MRAHAHTTHPLRGIGLCVVAVLLLATLVSAQETLPRVKENRIQFHSIDVFLASDGSANIEERFFFTFFADEAAQFAQDFEDNTPSLAEWRADYSFVRPHIGNEAQAGNVEFLLHRTPTGEPSLTMSYTYPAGLAQNMRTNNDGRSTRWRLSDATFVSFITGGNISIPANTQVRVHAPNGAIVDTGLLPQGITAAGNVITLSNFQSNSLEIQYTLISPIADPIDVSRIFLDFTKSPLFALVLGILVLAGAYLVVNRERVTNGIEGYIIEHSEFRPSPKQDIDGDLENVEAK